ncbi:uncharacterized protein LOC100210608 isoform X2 [Hydra vulgaris]|uniref:uncharacterized protein LOC100210608 isoform X2 n=1 Tax=Hydra vulgaris TaxID=6087 RepID=UPI001F5F6754|nr:uncharacterized protein LOC100210608 isoform X2 [Hydra vulgaris]
MNEDSCSLELELPQETMMAVDSTLSVEKHFFATYADVCAKIKEHEMLHTLHYVVTCSGTMENNFEELLKKKHKVFYEDKEFPYTGVPFIVSALTKLDCQHGKDRNIKAKAQYRQMRNKKASTDHYCQKSRVILQDTKKFDCPAIVYIKEIVEFPEFKTAGINQSISDDLIVKIGDLVKKGVNTISEMRRHLEFFVHGEITSDKPQKTNKRFFPMDKTIRNHMLNARRKLRRSMIDQECLLEKISEWKIVFHEAMIKFRPKGVNIIDNIDSKLKDSLLFVYQDMWQKRLLLRYGPELVFLDATYRTTRYALPLFFLVVKTNIDYQVVAIFVCENETTDAITEALMCIKEWNSKFQPKYFLTDYSNEEINSLESVFPGCSVLICDFHREQSWERWLSKTANCCYMVKDAIKLKLHQIAHAKTEEVCQNAVNSLKESEEWKNNPKLADYLNSTWLCNQKRWVFAYRRQRLLRSINTNNGTERQNQSFKYSFLEKRKTSSLTAMLCICIEEFLPHNYDNYADKNRTHSSYRKYKENIPTYLTNRPKPLVKHCMNMIDKVNGVDSIRISAVTNRLYNVASFQSNSRETYQCYLGDADHLPSCTCSSWLFSAYPCKHFFSIFLKFNLSWSDFDPSYGSSPYFIIDPLSDENNHSTTFHFTRLPTEDISENINEKPLDDAKPWEVSKYNLQAVKSVHSINSKVLYFDQSKEHGQSQVSHTPAACCELLNAIINMTHLSASQPAINNLFQELHKLKTSFGETLKREQGVILCPDLKPETWIKSNLPSLVNLPVRRKKKLTKRVGIKHDITKAALNINVTPNVNNECCSSEIFTDVIDDNCETFTVSMELIEVTGEAFDNCQEFHKVNIVNDNDKLQSTVHCIQNLKCSLIQNVEKNDIVKGEMLNDNVIHFCQRMMSIQFNIDVGLQDPIKGKVMSFDPCPSKPFVQILHDGNIHWVCITTYDCKPGEIYIFDSLFHGLISIETKRQICSILHCSQKKIVIKVLPVQQQTNGVDCGLYAIAWARQVLETNGIPPSTHMFEQNEMRNHLLNCILNNQLDVFPKAITPTMFRRCTAKSFHIPLHCSCRMFWTQKDEHIFNRQMAQCFTCNKWFHRECESIPVCAYEKEDVIWNCHDCQMQIAES